MITIKNLIKVINLHNIEKKFDDSYNKLKS